MRIEQATAFLYALKPQGIRFGLENTRLVLGNLGDPQKAFAVLHVAGSNGKGSTCAFLDAMLRAAGHRIGFFSSPHLIHFHERFQVQGQPVSDTAIERAMELLLRQGLQIDPAEVEDWLSRDNVVEQMQPASWYDRRGGASRFTRLTFFECTTVLAVLLFAQAGVDIAIMETGMGGRLDATNVFSPVVSVITPIHLEHTEVLGTTLAAIAGEKAGIIKRQVPVVIARQAPEAQGVLEHQALEVGAPLVRMGTEFEADGGWRAARFRIGKESLGPVRLGLVGDHQVVNAATALGCRPWLGKAGWRLPEAAVLEGLRSVCWPGRFECLGERGEWILDGAHNPDGIRALAGTVRDVLEGQPVRLVFGVLKEKDAGGMLPQLLPLASEVHLVRSSDARALEPAELLSMAGPGARVHSSMEAALEGLHNTPGPAILVTGSLTVAGQARAWLLDRGLRPTMRLRT